MTCSLFNLVISLSFHTSQFRFIAESSIALYHKRRISRVALWHIVMSHSLNFDDYTDLIKTEHEHDEFFLKFMINLFVAHYSNQTSTIKIETSKIKNESSKKLTKLVNISNTKKLSQKFICIVSVFDLSMNLNTDFIIFEKSQNIVFQNDTHYEWSFFINFISMKNRFEHFERFIL
jgi:hypothetical protein